MNPRYDTNTNPPWLKKGVGDDQSTRPSDAVVADTREPGFDCARPPLERMMKEVTEVLAKANARSVKDYPDADHPYASLCGARDADIIILTNIIESYLEVYGIEGLRA